MKQNAADPPTIADILRAHADHAAGVSEADVQQLLDIIRVQGQQYGHLLALLETLNTTASVHDTHSQAVLNSIQHQLGNLAASKEQLNRLQTRLGSDITARSPDLQQELKRQEELLKNCLTRIAQLETTFTERRKRLQPEMDESARRRTMQTAYQQSMKTG